MTPSSPVSAAATGAADTAPRTLLQTIEDLADAAPEEGFSLREIFDRLDESAFGAGLFLLALPCCIPFLYGVPQIVALPMLALAFQMLIGREEPWLPAKLGARKIDKKGLTQMARGGRKWLGWIEAIIRPRLSFITGPVSERVIGALLFCFCASILVPLPATNTVPGFAVAVTAFGLMQKDGLAVIGGCIVGTAWIGALVLGALTGIGLVVSAATGS
ncbi:exopolysaccharide biosynthesis protein [Hyphomonas sp.]|uniref:exopolysaccharide biosynthesis protein n=1 Tax=Hyphomonas sp. TaxID=87 RepID=UPI003918E049